jgi:competence protein ComEC
MLGLVLGPLHGRADGRLHASVLDVGQGDAIVVRSPNGRVIVVDAGNGGLGRGSDGERVVGPYLWSLGVRRVDRLVLSHAHPDHFGGAAFLVRAFAIGEVWEGPAPLQDRGYAELDRMLRAAAVRRRTVTAGLRETWDDVALEVLGPQRPARAPWRTRNDDSLVLRLQFGGVSLLLPGDVEGAGEAALPPRRADVLKVAHHGSRTGTTAGFLATSAPRLALVSAGRRNPFGHPHPEVLERCRRQGSLVLRTDRDGAMEVATDGSRLWLVTHQQPPAEIR